MYYMGYIRLCIYKGVLSMRMYGYTVGYRDKGVHMAYVYRYIVCMCIYVYVAYMYVYTMLCVYVCSLYVCMIDSYISIYV